MTPGIFLEKPAGLERGGKKKRGPVAEGCERGTEGKSAQNRGEGRFRDKKDCGGQHGVAKIEHYNTRGEDGTAAGQCKRLGDSREQKATSEKQRGKDERNPDIGGVTA